MQAVYVLKHENFLLAYTKLDSIQIANAPCRVATNCKSTELKIPCESLIYLWPASEDYNLAIVYRSIILVPNKGQLYS